MKALLHTAAFALACVTSAFAQEAPASSGVDQDEIVVTAPSREVVQEFVGQLSATPNSRTMARWDSSFCAGVVGMHAPHAQFMIDRISATAIRLGLQPGESGCRPNILIFMTNDADRVAQELAADTRVISPRNRHGNTRGREALAEFAATPRPVRWWHLSRSVTADGFEVARGNQVSVPEMGRLRGTLRQDLSAAFIVIDANLVRGVRIDALSDYVAFAALAQLDPEAEVGGFPTILALFEANTPAEARPTALTTWDLGYLDGLYTATRTARSARQQEEEISRRVGQ